MKEKPNKLQKLGAHLKENADIYAPLALFVAGSAALAVLGVVVVKEAKANLEAMEKVRASFGENARVFMDVETGIEFIATPVE